MIIPLVFDKREMISSGNPIIEGIIPLIDFWRKIAYRIMIT